MSRTVEVTCDYCTASIEAQDEEELLGWISADKFDIVSGELKDLDFCSDECAASYFS